MTELKGWCVVRYNGGAIGYKSTHNFLPYETFFLKRLMYKCRGGMKNDPEGYIEYSKYLIARDEVLRNKK